MFKRLKSNEGITLVELLVSVAVLGILMSGVFALMSGAARYFGDSQKEVEVQNQLQTAFVQVSNMLIDANVDLSYDSSTNMCIACNDKEFYVIQKVGNSLYASTGKYSDEVLTKDNATKVNFAKDYVAQGKHEQSLNTCITERCETFIVDKSSFSKGYVVLALRFTYHNRTAYLSQNVFLRNSSGASSVVGSVDTNTNTGGNTNPGSGESANPTDEESKTEGKSEETTSSPTDDVDNNETETTGTNTDPDAGNTGDSGDNSETEITDPNTPPENGRIELPFTVTATTADWNQVQYIDLALYKGCKIVNIRYELVDDNKSGAHFWLSDDIETKGLGWGNNIDLGDAQEGIDKALNATITKNNLWTNCIPSIEKLYVTIENVK